MDAPGVASPTAHQPPLRPPTAGARALPSSMSSRRAVGSIGAFGSPQFMVVVGSVLLPVSVVAASGFPFAEAMPLVSPQPAASASAAQAATRVVVSSLV